MNKQHFFLGLILLFFNGFITAQCDTSRYFSPVFDSVEVQHDVKYGVAEKWNIPYNDMDLFMDIYTPHGDSLENRPLMLWVHGGGFLFGEKSAEDVVAFCDSFARRGYVTASVEYRLGFNPTSAKSAERAVYRGVQDLRAAVRYMKENHDVYGIDTNYTFVGGTSAGGFSAVQLVYMDQNEAPASYTGGISPNLGCLDCSGNSYSHNMDITGYANLWGAVGDSLWIQPDETAKGLLVHGTGDGTVPFAVGHPFGVSTTPLTQGSRCISNQLDALSIPHTNYFVNINEHGVYDTDNGNWDGPPPPRWDTVFNMVETHYGELLQSDILAIQGDMSVCTSDTLMYVVQAPNSRYQFCWEVTNGTILDNFNDSVRVVFDAMAQGEISVKQFNEIASYSGASNLTVDIYPEPTVNFATSMEDMSVQFSPLPTGFSNYFWDVGDGTQYSSLSPTHQYDTPGMYTVSLTVTDQNGCQTSQEKSMDFSTLAITENQFDDFQLFPNPVNDELHVQTSSPMQSITIYSTVGSIIQHVKVKESVTTLNTSKLSRGTYIIEVQHQNGSIQVQRLVK